MRGDIAVLTRCAALCVLLCGASACRDTGIEVTSLEIEGNTAFPDQELRQVIVTRADGWLPWSRGGTFDQQVFEADLERLRAFYVDRGFPDARVRADAVDLNDANTEVGLRIAIDEGAPLVVERVDITGIESLDSSLQAEIRGALPGSGGRLDRRDVAAARDRIAFLLRDRGFSDPRVSTEEVPEPQGNRVGVRFDVEPGPSATFGEISISRSEQARVRDSVIRRALTFEPGDLYRESDVLESQRRLSTTGLFSFAHVSPRGEAAEAGGSVPMVVTVTEASATQTQIGVGYGTEEGPRGSFAWRHRNLMGDARQLSFTARYSGILRGAELEFVEPYLWWNGLSFSATTGAWWRDEPSFTARSVGGRTGIAYLREIPRGFNRTPVQYRFRLTYINEAETYRIDEDTLTDITQFDDLIALGFDPVTGEGSGRVGAIELSGERIDLDRPLDPTTGSVLRANVEFARPALGGTYRYTEFEAEARGFVPLGRAVLAGRARAARINAVSDQDVPFSGRFFLGGVTSLRGWGRLQVAPLTPDGLPIGGLSTFETSGEIRYPFGTNWGAALFVDAGNVWEEPGGIDPGDLRADVGTGVWYRTPFALVRADVGWQLTPIDGLVVGGEAERRRWRIHLSIGHAF